MLALEGREERAADVLEREDVLAVAGRGLLILGPSGAGKSALALQIMALGGQLVADDRVELTRQGDEVIARCPAPLRGLIEARGLGLGRALLAEVMLAAAEQRLSYGEALPPGLRLLAD